MANERDRSGSIGQSWRGFLLLFALGASLVWSASAQAGGDPSAADEGGVPLPRAGEAVPMIVESQSTAPGARPSVLAQPAAGGSGEDVVVVVSGEGTQVYSLSDYRTLRGAGGVPADSAEQPALPVAPPEPIAELAPVPQPAPEAPIQTAKHKADSDGLGGFLSEMRIGVMAHDVGAFGRNKEEGPDINAELLFVSPEFLELIYAPRPHLGISANTSGDTSQIYAGLTWDYTFWETFFVA